MTQSYIRTSLTTVLASLIALVASTSALAHADAAQPTAPVTVEQGQVQGVDDGGIRHYFGLPYAAPPVGDLRWKEPLPAPRWQGLRAADHFGHTCIQAPFPHALGQVGQYADTSEDCLYLNVWAPSHPSSGGRLPVMVWIHGGGYFFGSGADPILDGTNFARKGVVLVTINYRLGALGFLVHPALTAESTHHSSGNYGILDQIAALKWIKANIAAFGGDPGNITVFGESAGSGSVNILSASPLAKGLFQRAIGESTSQMDPAAGMMGRMDFRAQEAYGTAFARLVGARTLNELRTVPAQQIADLNLNFWPTERDNYVLPDLVFDTFARGEQNRVSTLVGWNSNEGATLAMEWIRPFRPAQKAAFAALYPEDTLRRSSTDAVEWHMRSWANLQVKAGERDVWMYRFDRAWPGMPQLGAFHGAEIVYAFGNFGAIPGPWTQTDRDLSDQMRSYWVNFARSGNPNGPGLPVWPRYDRDMAPVEQLGARTGAIEMPGPDAQRFLDGYQADQR